ncbi:MAG: chromosome partitioning protein, partial [Cryptosporangiaceae bacterium]|nr:chromosome partitioning protein [Cryptosporangiaceae bacterium]
GRPASAADPSHTPPAAIEPPIVPAPRAVDPQDPRRAPLAEAADISSRSLDATPMSGGVASKADAEIGAPADRGPRPDPDGGSSLREATPSATGAADPNATIARAPAPAAITAMSAVPGGADVRVGLPVRQAAEPQPGGRPETTAQPGGDSVLAAAARVTGVAVPDEMTTPAVPALAEATPEGASPVGDTAAPGPANLPERAVDRTNEPSAEPTNQAAPGSTDPESRPSGRHRAERGAEHVTNADEVGATGRTGSALPVPSRDTDQAVASARRAPLRTAQDRSRPRQLPRRSSKRRGLITDEVEETDVSDTAQFPGADDASEGAADESHRRIKAMLHDATVSRETPNSYRGAPMVMDVSRETDPLTSDLIAPDGSVLAPTGADDDLLIAAEARRAVAVLNPRGTQLPRPLKRRVLCVANQKGGVGKTTTTVNLAVALALHGARVLVVDLDPQGNASTGLSVDHHSGVPSAYDLLVDAAPLEEVAVEVEGVPNLYCVPATIDLAGAEIELVSVVARESRLRRAIDEFPGQLDYVFIDCPPSLGLLTVNALVAAREVLIPIQCEYYALEGLGQLLRNVDLVRAHLNNDVRVSTILLTMYDGRTKLADQVAAEVREHFPDQVLKSVIPRSVRVSEAPGYGQSVITYDPGSRGASSYLEAAREIAERGMSGGVATS